jgi:hypothetical protein
MFRNASTLDGSIINATDGEIGHVEDAYFHDEAWTIRYLVVDTGTWLIGRKVLISPNSVTQPLGASRIIDVSLTREQVRNSPDIDTHRPVLRQHEREYLGYYGYPTAISHTSTVNVFVRGRRRRRRRSSADAARCFPRWRPLPVTPGTGRPHHAGQEHRPAPAGVAAALRLCPEAGRQPLRLGIRDRPTYSRVSNIADENGTFIWR